MQFKRIASIIKRNIFIIYLETPGGSQANPRASCAGTSHPPPLFFPSERVREGRRNDCVHKPAHMHQTPAHARTRPHSPALTHTHKHSPAFARTRPIAHAHANAQSAARTSASVILAFLQPMCDALPRCRPPSAPPPRRQLAAQYDTIRFTTLYSVRLAGCLSLSPFLSFASLPMLVGVWC